MSLSLRRCSIAPVALCERRERLDRTFLGNRLTLAVGCKKNPLASKITIFGVFSKNAERLRYPPVTRCAALPCVPSAGGAGRRGGGELEEAPQRGACVFSEEPSHPSRLSLTPINTVSVINHVYLSRIDPSHFLHHKGPSLKPELRVFLHKGSPYFTGRHSRHAFSITVLILFCSMRYCRS